MKNENQTPALEPSIDGGFIRTIQTHQGGKTISDLSAAIRDVTAAVREHCKPGKVVFTMTISPAVKGQEDAMGFECDVVVKLPRGQNYAGIFFADDDNNLVRENPNQQNLPALRTVETETEETPLKKVQQT